MANTVPVNFRILRETAEKLNQMSRGTFRGKGDLIDWLVAEEYQRMYPGEEAVPAADGAAKKGGLFQKR